MLEQSPSSSLSSYGVVSRSEAIVCSILSYSSILAGEACALLIELLGHGLRVLGTCALLIELLGHGLRVLGSHVWLRLHLCFLCCNRLVLSRLGRLVGVCLE
jgi:hypothetical protein